MARDATGIGSLTAVFGRTRDPRQVRFFTIASLRWVIRNRAWSWWYLVRYWRFLLVAAAQPAHRHHWLRLRPPSPGTRTQGICPADHGRCWHVGDENRIRAHEGTMRIGDKCVFGRDNTVNGYLDIEFGSGCIVADWVYVVRLRPRLRRRDDPDRTRAGQVSGAHRSGLLARHEGHRPARNGGGQRCILAANSVVRGEVPPESIVAGVPGRVVKNRREVYDALAQRRAALAHIKRRPPTPPLPTRQTPSKPTPTRPLPPPRMHPGDQRWRCSPSALVRRLRTPWGPCAPPRRLRARWCTNAPSASRCACSAPSVRPGRATAPTPP